MSDDYLPHQGRILFNIVWSSPIMVWHPVINAMQDHFNLWISINRTPADFENKGIIQGKRKCESNVMVTQWLKPI